MARASKSVAPPQNSKQAGKRTVINLVSSDDEAETRPEKTPRSTNNSGSQSISSSQTQSSQTSNVVDEEDAGELVAWSQDDGTTNDTFELYGTLPTKIVGIRYYSGCATIGECVLLRREPTNPYDRNAIRVDNVQRTQIGHIPRQVASKLAKYIDEGSLIAEAVLAGRRGEYDCPVTVALYGTSDPAGRETLKERMAGDRLPLDSLKRREREEKKRRAEELKKVAKKGSRVKAEFASDPSQATGESAQTLDDIMVECQRFNPRHMGEIVEKFGSDENALSKMPMANNPPRIATVLLPYQRQGLTWLLDRENPQLPTKGSQDIVQLWKRSREDTNMFTNVATNFSVKNSEPKLASGGILADDMGLGKTLEIISLIVADLETNKLETAQEGNATLIIAPLSVMSNWSGQIAHHVTADRPLRVLTYHGTGRKPMVASDFAEYDVVITTYGTLSAEYMPKGKAGKASPPPVPRPFGLYSVKWRRIVLDEGHNIRNPSTKGSQAATVIMARSRWALTGTPIVNGLKDLYSLVRFIGLTGGLERLEVFNSALIRPFKEGHEDANVLLQALMSTICLRRRKEMKFIDLKLPKLNEYIHRIKFTPSEMEKYDALRAEAKGLLETFQIRQSAGDKKAQETYRHLFEILLRLRQVCNHWKLCAKRVTSLLSQLEAQKVVDLTPENRKALQDMLMLSIESREDCPICLDELTGHAPVITHCGHIFGTDCITRVIGTQAKCPMCRAPLEDESKLVQPAAGLGETDGDPDMDAEIDDENTSSKVRALLSILAAAHKKPDPKIVIFSQWCRFLDLLEPHFHEAGYQYARIDGSMPAPARDASLKALDSDPKCTILLASLGVCAVGLNLVAANQVVLCDSWWAPAIEDQAVDRVHRLGQKRDCTVWRLVMEDSIEERTLQIQADKRKLMSAAFREKGKRGQGSHARLGDIQKLLGG